MHNREVEKTLTNSDGHCFWYDKKYSGYFFSFSDQYQHLKTLRQFVNSILIFLVSGWIHFPYFRSNLQPYLKPRSHTGCSTKLHGLKESVFFSFLFLTRQNLGVSITLLFLVYEICVHPNLHCLKKPLSEGYYCWHFCRKYLQVALPSQVDLSNTTKD